jgi:hypothetical protein
LRGNCRWKFYLTIGKRGNYLCWKVSDGERRNAPENARVLSVGKLEMRHYCARERGKLALESGEMLRRMRNYCVGGKLAMESGECCGE